MDPKDVLSPELIRVIVLSELQSTIHTKSLDGETYHAFLKVINYYNRKVPPQPRDHEKGS